MYEHCIPTLITYFLELACAAPPLAPSSAVIAPAVYGQPLYGSRAAYSESSPSLLIYRNFTQSLGIS